MFVKFLLKMNDMIVTCAGVRVSGTCNELGLLGRDSTGGVSRVAGAALVTAARLAADNIILENKINNMLKSRFLRQYSKIFINYDY